VETGLAGKRVLVTGGSGGIGSACAREFAAEGVDVEAELHLAALGVGLGLALGFLGGRLEGAQTAHFVHDPLGIELVLPALERAVNGFSLADDDFWHKWLG